MLVCDSYFIMTDRICQSMLKETVGYVLGQFDYVELQNYCCSLNVNLVMMTGAQLIPLIQAMLHLLMKGSEELVKFEQDAPHHR